MVQTSTRTNNKSQRNYYSQGFCYSNWLKNKVNEPDVVVKEYKRNMFSNWYISANR